MAVEQDAISKTEGILQPGAGELIIPKQLSRKDLFKYAWTASKAGVGIGALLFLNRATSSLETPAAILQTFLRLSEVERTNGGKKELKLEYGNWVVEQREGLYVSKSAHYVETAFLPGYQKLKNIIGLPLSEPLPMGCGEGTGDQYFEKAVLACIPPGYRKEIVAISTPVNNNLYFLPLAADFFLDPQNELSPLGLKDRIDRTPRQELDPRIQKFVDENGFQEFIGKIISNPSKKDGEIIQFTANFGFSIDERSGKVTILDLGSFFAQPAESDEFLPRFPTYLELVKVIKPDLGTTLAKRSASVINYIKNDSRPVLDDESDVRDYLIIKDMMGGSIARNRVLKQEEVKELLAEYMVKYELSPTMIRVLEKLNTAWLAIDRANHKTLFPGRYEDGRIPTVPHLFNRFIFNKHLGNWGNASGYPEVFDNYGSLEYLKEEGYDEALDYLSSFGLHELVHSITQQGLKIPGPPIMENLDLRLKENRLAHAGHVSMGVVVSVGREALGLSPTFDPRLVYIHSKMVNFRKDAIEVIYRAGATGDATEMWEIYEKLREESDLSMNQLFGQEEFDKQFTHYTGREKNQFLLGLKALES